MGKISTGVFERYGQDTISSRVFYAIIAFVLIWGFVLTTICANYAINLGVIPTVWSVILIGLVVPIIGIVISVKSSNPIVSFLGYNLVVAPLGFVLGPSLQEYSPDVIKHVMMLTIGCSVVFGALGISFPNFFSRLGRVLFASLCILIVVRILQLFIPALAVLTWVDYISAGLFCLYIGYDMYRASSMPKTVDNAVDICVDLYLDIINLFLSLLNSSKNSNDWLIVSCLFGRVGFVWFFLFFMYIFLSIDF